MGLTVLTSTIKTWKSWNNILFQVGQIDWNMHFENEKLAFRRRLEKNLAGDNAKPALMQILNQEAPYEIKGEKKQKNRIRKQKEKKINLKENV